MKTLLTALYAIFSVIVVALGFKFDAMNDYTNVTEGLLPPTTTTQPIEITVTPLPAEHNKPVTTTARTVRVDDVPDDVLCPEWWSTLKAFWPEPLLRQADFVMWSETRCQNLHRSNVGRIGYGDHGLFQINAINLDYLSTYGVTAEDLMTPAQNVVAARILYVWAERQYGCGWQPWYSSVDPWALCDE